MSEPSISLFSDLNLGEPLLRVLGEVGYESPSPIQAATIPILLSNRDVLGQAQTGTGKTAAFALPILARLDLAQSAPQALVLAPTRELAIQVAEAFQRYATHIPGFHVLPIYGGQSYGPQLSALRRGVHVVVGTPGRVIDHLDKGSLDLSQIKTLVLDEADEMLRMGFIDDVERILQETPEGRQTALFSATMPPAIRRIAQTYLRQPEEVTVAAKTGTADNIRQRYWQVTGMHKLDALTRILETETFDGMIIFSRTKLGTEELATKLQARGFSAAAINGDVQQQQRERTIDQLKEGKIDILVATDVAARGLDVERISHVINYDVPHDPESYTHRIGRTGRAGRSGEAILFITPREKGLLKAIERATRQPIAPLELPTIQTVNNVRIARFKEQIDQTLALGELEIFQSIVEEYEQEKNVSALEIAAALAKMARGNVPFLLDKRQPAEFTPPERSERPARFEGGGRERFERPERTERFERPQQESRGERFERPARQETRPERFERPPQQETRPERFERPTQQETRPERFERPAQQETRPERFERPPQRETRPERFERPVAQETRPERFERPNHSEARPERFERPAERPAARGAEVGMQTYRIEVGHLHGVKAGNIVGAIANEAGLESRYIGRIDIQDEHSTVDLPVGMPKELLGHLKSVWVAGQQLRIAPVGGAGGGGSAGGGDSGGKRPPLGVPKSGGDRRVMERDAGKGFGAKPKFKPQR